MTGDAAVIMMADESDDCRDVVRYWEQLNQGYDCVFGSRFSKGGGVIDYPLLQADPQPHREFFIRILFRIKLNDTTNAFKAYRKTVIDGCRPLLAPHFNLTVEIPLKAIVRGYSAGRSFPSPGVIAGLALRNSRSRKWAAATSSSARISGWRNISAGATINDPALPPIQVHPRSSRSRVRRIMLSTFCPGERLL